MPKGDTFYIDIGADNGKHEMKIEPIFINCLLGRLAGKNESCHRWGACGDRQNQLVSLFSLGCPAIKQSNTTISLSKNCAQKRVFLLSIHRAGPFTKQ